MGTSRNRTFLEKTHAHNQRQEEWDEQESEDISPRQVLHHKTTIDRAHGRSHSSNQRGDTHEHTQTLLR